MYSTKNVFASGGAKIEWMNPETMERYTTAVSSDPSTWESAALTQSTELTFSCGELLGRGANCSVYAVVDCDDAGECDSCESECSHESDGDWTREYFGCDDIQSEHDSDSLSDVSYFSSGSDSGSEGWATVESSVGPVPPVTASTSMGVVELAVKVFEHLPEDTCYQGTTRDGRVYFELSASRFVKWFIAQGSGVRARMLTHSVTATSVRLSAFSAERLIHVMLSELVTGGVTPHVVMALRAESCEDRGYIIQERISSTFPEALEEDSGLDVTGMASLYLQVLVTLHMLQHACGFKHHDLHTDNVFLKRVDDTVTWRGSRLSSATHFSYDLGERGVLTVPNCGYIVKIGDFADASLDLHGRRLHKLDALARVSRSFGDWSQELVGQRGYDAQLLLGDPPFEPDSWRAEDTNTTKFLRRLRRAAQGKGGKLTSTRHRPVVGHVSDVPPLSVIDQVFITGPCEFADFTQPPPPGSTTVCLTTVGSLSGEAPAHHPKRRRKGARKIKAA